MHCRRFRNGIGLQGVIYEKEFRFSKRQVASFFGIEERTLNYYLKSHSEELRQNGYIVLAGKELKDFIRIVSEQNVEDVWEMSSRTPKLAVFNFRAFLNLAMLLVHNLPLISGQAEEQNILTAAVPITCPLQ